VGGAALRSGALTDDEVLAYVNAHFEPYWVDVRSEPVPNLPVVGSDVMLGSKLDAKRMVDDPLSQGFFLRTLVLTPDGATVLNRQSATVKDSVETHSRCGYFAYAQTQTQDVLKMLRSSVNVHEGRFDAGFCRVLTP